jgi:hypothetical protein
MKKRHHIAIRITCVFLLLFRRKAELGLEVFGVVEDVADAVAISEDWWTKIPIPWTATPT